jgi:hypothetical protein
LSEQAKILEEMQQIIMKILKTGEATPQEGDRMDALEDLLHEQKCFQATTNANASYIGEEIANLFYANNISAAVKMMQEQEIEPEDFFGFAEYHFEEEEDTEMFDAKFVAEVKKLYNAERV